MIYKMVLVCPICYIINNNNFCSNGEGMIKHLFERESGAYYYENNKVVPRKESVYFGKIYNVRDYRTIDMIKSWRKNIICEICLGYIDIYEKNNS